MTYEDTMTFDNEEYSLIDWAPQDDMLAHWGVARRSGRYPWGSGDDPYQHNGNFASRVNELRKSGFSYTDEDGVTYKGDSAIARYMGLDAQEFRAAYSMSKDEKRLLMLDRAKSLKKDGKSNSEIAKIMGLPNESSVRSLFNIDSEAKTRAAFKTAEFIKSKVDELGMIDVGGGVEHELNISREKLNEALFILAGEGYNTFGGRVEQRTNPGQHTTLRVITPPGTPYKINKNGQMTSSAIYDFDKVHSLKDYTSHDNGETFDKKWVYPASMKSKRLAIRYAEEGGLAKDGLIEIRPNVPDLSLGNSAYSQVRILVDGTHYLKGMAVYSNNLPKGVDILFNTNKPKGTPPLGEDKNNTVLKKIKTDNPNNPFGSLIKPGIDDPKKSDSYEGGQSYYYDKAGHKKLSLINKRGDEGDWGEWAKKLPSQFLAKQNKTLIKRQLQKTMDETKAELDDIMALTNPVVKKNLLMSFSRQCDSNSVHLQATALPRQKYQVILPLTSIKDTEIYAPNYKDGETVALIRYPHAGTFEIPILRVNNKNREGRDVIGINPKDAVGINSKTASILSGADFDGDTVMVIPTGKKVNITSRPPLKELENFDPSMAYPARPGMKVMTKGATGQQMGQISNLIMDMTIRGATDEELAKAVKHSMVVIDAEKHKLDYKKSEQDNDIKRLKIKYQGVVDPETGKINTPAGTLLTRAKSDQTIPKRRGSPRIDPETGKLIWKNADEYYTDKQGRTHMRMQRSTKMAETDDARTLISDAHSAQEELYADFANYMKAMGNQARLAYSKTKVGRRNSDATKVYAAEVAKLDADLLIAEKNRPRERQAQLIATSYINALKMDNPDMKNKEIRKYSQMALTEARAKVGAHRYDIPISDKQWEAIQAGAVSANTLDKVLQHTNVDRLRELATPKDTKTVSASKINRMQSLANQGKYTNAQIAEKLGVSVDVVNKYVD